MAFGGSIRAASAYVSLSLQQNQFITDLSTVQAKFKNFARSFTNIGKSLFIFGGVAAAPLGLLIKRYIEFDDATRRAAAATRKAADTSEMMAAKLALLRDEAKRLGLTTSFTSVEVALLQEQLAKGGFDIDEIKASTKAVLDLARATGASTDVAGKLVARMARVFNVDTSNVEEIENIADGLVATVNNSLSDIEEVAFAFSYAGNTSALIGQAKEETLAFVGALSNVGIASSQAGTALRRLDLITAKDAKSIEKKFGAVIVKTEEGGLDLATTLENIFSNIEHLDALEQVAAIEEIFQVRSTGAAAALGKDIKPYRELLEEIKDAQDANLAAKAAKDIDAGIGGRLRLMLSALEGFALSVADILDKPLTKLMEGVTTALRQLSGLVTENKNLVLAVTAALIAVPVLGAALFALGATMFTVAVTIQVFIAVLKGLLLMLNLLRVSALALRAAMVLTNATFLIARGIILVFSTTLSIARAALIALLATTLAVRISTLALQAAILSINVAMMAYRLSIALTILGLIGLRVTLVATFATMLSLVGVIRTFVAALTFARIVMFATVVQARILAATLLTIKTAVLVVRAAIAGMQTVLFVIEALARLITLARIQAWLFAATMRLAAAVTVAWRIAIAALAPVIALLKATVIALKTAFVALQTAIFLVTAVFKALATAATIVRVVINALRVSVVVFQAVVAVTRTVIFAMVGALTALRASVLVARAVVLATSGAMLLWSTIIRATTGLIYAFRLAVIATSSIMTVFRLVVLGVVGAFTLFRAAVMSATVVSLFSQAVAFALSPLGSILITIGLVTLAFVYFGDTIGSLVGWIKKKFGDLLDNTIETFKIIALLLANGDIKTAGAIFWKYLQYAWVTGTGELEKVWNDFLAGFQKIWFGTQAEITKGILNVAGKVKQLWSDIKELPTQIDINQRQEAANARAGIRRSERNDELQRRYNAGEFGAVGSAEAVAKRDEEFKKILLDYNQEIIDAGQESMANSNRVQEAAAKIAEDTASAIKGIDEQRDKRNEDIDNRLDKRQAGIDKQIAALQEELKEALDKAKEGIIPEGSDVDTEFSKLIKNMLDKLLGRTPPENFAPMDKIKSVGTFSGAVANRLTGGETKTTADVVDELKRTRAEAEKARREERAEKRKLIKAADDATRANVRIADFMDGLRTA